MPAAHLVTLPGDWWQVDYVGWPPRSKWKLKPEALQKLRLIEAHYQPMNGDEPKEPALIHFKDDASAIEFKLGLT